MQELLADGAELELVQLVAPDGTSTAVDGLDPTPVHDRLPELYELMVVTRELDEEYVNLQRQGELALFPSCRGQEAAQIGCASALRDTDWLFPQYRELGVFLARGVEPGGIGLAWRGTWHGGSGLVERCIAPISIAIGTHTLHAAGSAMASTWLGDEGVSVAFIGDGATSEGDVHEALNLAAVHDAPCIFYVQNNGWAISTPPIDQYRVPTLAQKADGYGMRGVRVDGNDVVACHVVVAEAAARARRGEGPTLIEAMTYRMSPHTTADDPTRYRGDDEVAMWKERDPIARCEAYMRRLGTWDDEISERAQARAAELRTELRGVVFDAPDRRAEEVFDYVFSETTPLLEAERAELLAELEQD